MTDGDTTAEAEDGLVVLTERDFFGATDPIALFEHWLAEAAASEPNDPNATALATVDPSGMPDVRMVLLKGFDRQGFVFYTNLESRKGQQLAAVPSAALCFHWKSLRRQVRLRGHVAPVSAAEADDYFLQRPRLSRVGAWASSQSRPLESRQMLQERVDRYTEQFGEDLIPRPPHWSGFRIAPVEIEFWRDGPFRLHDRLRFTRTEEGAWSTVRLYP